MNSRDIERNRHRREGGVELVREPSERERESRRIKAARRVKQANRRRGRL